MTLKNKLLVHYVHCNFETETHFSSSWFCPHSNFSFIKNSYRSRFKAFALREKHYVPMLKMQHDISH